MNFDIYDKKRIGKKTWYLTKSNLASYMQCLKENFFNFEIQRRIVKNVYLDGILRTIEDGDPMPVITLTISDSIEPIDSSRLIVEDFDILDGLQRTYRLWVVWRIIVIANTNSCRDYKELLNRLKSDEEGNRLLELDFVTVKLLRQLFEEDGKGEIYKDKLLALYEQYDMVFALWEGLTDDEIIKKMLILNAGQRSVSSVHQFELLFLHFFDANKLNLNQDIHLYREKDKRYYSIRRGIRNAGEYALASIIIALQSYIEGKPLRVDPSNKVRFEDDASVEGDVLLYYFNEVFLSSFIDRIYRLDCQLKQKGANYEMWYGKDTTLSGIFAAIGSVLNENTTDLERLDRVISAIASKPDPFKIGDFDNAYSELSSVRINVGKVLREAIFVYTKGLLTGNEMEWYQAFNSKE